MSNRLTRPPSRELGSYSAISEDKMNQPTLEETFYLADLSRRKSSERIVREDLRLKLGHSNVLGSLLQDIARRSPPPSPKQIAAKPVARHIEHSHSSTTKSSSSSQGSSSRTTSLTWADLPNPKTTNQEVDEYGFAYDDGSSDDYDEDDDNGLALTRTVSRKPQ